MFRIESSSFACFLIFDIIINHILPLGQVCWLPLFSSWAKEEGRKEGNLNYNFWQFGKVEYFCKDINKRLGADIGIAFRPSTATWPSGNPFGKANLDPWRYDTMQKSPRYIPIHLFNEEQIWHTGKKCWTILSQQG